MKTILVMVTTTLTLSTAFGATKTVTCVGPVGGKVSSLTGTLSLTPQANGQSAVNGSIKINQGKALVVVGGYDNLDGNEYAMVGTTKASKIEAIYINFNDNDEQALSYVEIGGKLYPLNCNGSK